MFCFMPLWPLLFQVLSGPGTKHPLVLLATAMPNGTVKKFFEDKGFGFITPDDGSEDIFVHRRQCGGDDRGAYLEEGDKVEYEVEWNDQKGKYSASSCSGWKSGGGGGGGGGGYDSWGGGGKGGGKGKGYSPY